MTKGEKFNMDKIIKKVVLIGVISLFLFAALVLILSNFRNQANKPPNKEARESEKEQSTQRLTTIASNLEIPWALAFLPGGDILFTERPGKVKLVDKNGSGNPALVADIAEVKHIGEGGLLGIALHPDFANNKYVYLYYTYSGTKDNTLNRVVRYKFENGRLTNQQIIVDAIPGAVNHNGGRIKFGPDNFLYIATGDAQNPSLAQDINSLSGKILRVTDDGKPADTNPFGNLIYSWGHRNPQGLTWDNKGRLWATEHGNQAHDELNLIEKGTNYGWPVITGDGEKEGMRKPVLQSGSATWAPSGAAYVLNSIFFAGLRGNALYEAKIVGSGADLGKHLKGELGRIREVVLAPDGFFLYITTSNRDTRGVPRDGDDKIIKINVQKL